MNQAPAAFAGLRCPQSQLQAETRHRRRQARDAAPFERPRLCGRLRARKPAYPVTSPGDAGVGSRTDVKALSESPLVHLYCKKLTPLNLDGFFHPEPDHVGRQVDLAKASHDDRFSQPRPARPQTSMTSSKFVASHEAMAHEHGHVHDGHHRHDHDGPVTEPHSHWHRHEPMRHEHVQYPRPTSSPWRRSSRRGGR